MKNIAIIDFGLGNQHSVLTAFNSVGAEAFLTDSTHKIKDASAIVIIGVGSFGAVSYNLQKYYNSIERAVTGGKPILGICVGMQIMFETSEESPESNAKGLGFYNANIEKLKASKIPHIGWSKVEAPANSVLFDGIENNYFYFVHSYCAKNIGVDIDSIKPPFKPPLLSYTQYESGNFISAIENDNIFATQFHPEKSSFSGLKLLKNWASLIK